MFAGLILTMSKYRQRRANALKSAVKKQDKAKAAEEKRFVQAMDQQIGYWRAADKKHPNASRKVKKAKKK